jgi:paired amphipathic helix protein Sin3a
LNPAGPYHPVGQSAGHSLPGLADLAQGHGGPHQPSPYGQHAQPSHGAGHSLPGIGQAMQHPSPQLNRDRERDSREREMLERQRHEDMVHREREQREREREHMERQREQQHTVQSHTGSIPIHQPVASKVQNSIHGPNGLLSSIGGAAAAANPPQGSLQSGGPAGLFGAQIPSHQDNGPRPYMQHPQAPPAQQLLGFNNATPAQIPGNVAALAQGQQPILNVSTISSAEIYSPKLLECGD